MSYLPRSTVADHQPADHNEIAWSFDPSAVQAGLLLPTAGLLQLVRVKLTRLVATNIIMHVYGAGSTLTAGQCLAGLYSASGTLFGAGAVTADQSTNWQTGGIKTMPLTVAQAVPVGYAYVGFFANGVTLPTFARGLNGSPVTNVGLSSPNLRYCTADAGLTTAMPNSFGAQTGISTAWWVGVS